MIKEIVYLLKFICDLVWVKFLKTSGWSNPSTLEGPSVRIRKIGLCYAAALVALFICSAVVFCFIGLRILIVLTILIFNFINHFTSLCLLNLFYQYILYN